MGRTMRIRYAPPSMGGIPQVTIAELDNDPSLAARFAGKVVFAGVTAQTATRSLDDALFQWHHHARRRDARQRLRDHGAADVPRGCAACAPWSLSTFLLAIGAGLAYAFTSGWLANMLTASRALERTGRSRHRFRALHGLAVDAGHCWPSILATAAAAAWRHLLVRRELVHAEQEKSRYQQAMQFVTHEMRTPLTAIQGSSELIGRYGSMPEAKRKQMAELINAESKRLARMIETFLSVERMSGGQMEIKQERFPLHDLVERCAEPRPPPRRQQANRNRDRRHPAATTSSATAN